MKITKNELREYTTNDNFFVECNGKWYNVGKIQGAYYLIDEDLNETQFKDFNDIWDNLQIEGVYLRDMINDINFDYR